MNSDNCLESVDEIQDQALSELLTSGSSVNPRKIMTWELCPWHFCLTNPRKRCVTNPTRHWSLPFALGELSWHLAGSQELSFIEYYGKRWRDFSDDGMTIPGSCYGYQAFHENSEGSSQWKRIISLLESDSDSRRAVLTFLQPESQLDNHFKDVPCVCFVQFLIRNGQLHAFVSMRSNDVIWGLPYDVFFFTMLQELAASELQLPLGRYHHTTTSLHLYDYHIQIARKILADRRAVSFEMPAMDHSEELKVFLAVEGKLRTGSNVTLQDDRNLSAYWRNLAQVLQWYKQSRNLTAQLSRPLIPLENPYRSLLLNSEKSRTASAGLA
jgi:thymidylate synthase